MIVLAVIAVIVVIWRWADDEEKLPPRPKELLGEKHAEMHRAFRDDCPALDSTDARDIREMLLTFSRRLSAGRTDEAAEAIDMDRLLAEVRRIADRPGFSRLDRRKWSTAVRKSTARALAEVVGEDFRWNDVRVTLLRPTDLDEEFLVYTRLRDMDGGLSRMRWWLCRSDEQWAIYDWEDLSLGLRQSDMIALLSKRDPEKVERLGKNLLRRVQAFNASFDEGDFEEADRRLVEVLQLSLPKRFRVEFLAIRAIVQVNAGRPIQALEYCEEGEGYGIDMPLLLLARALTCNALYRHKEARDAVLRYRWLLGSDAASCSALGDALRGLGDTAEANKVYTQGLDHDSNDIDNLVGFGLSLPPERKGEIAERFGKLQGPDTSFAWMAEAFTSEADALALEVLLTARRRAAPQDIDLAYYTAQLHLLREQYRPAAAILLAALPRVQGDDRTAYSLAYVDAMVGLNEPLVGYRAALEPDAAFERVADALLLNDDADRLAELITLHRAKSPRHLALHYYTGQLHELGGAFAKAVDAYRAGLQRAADEPTRETYRAAVIMALYHDGRAEQAYETAQSKSAVFDQLAGWMWVEEKADELARLIDRHVAVEPDDAGLAYWRARLHWMRKEYARVAAVLAENESRMLDDDWPPSDDLWIPSLLHLKRYDDALRAAGKVTERNDDPYYETMVHAARGDAEKTAAGLERLVERGYDAGDFHDMPFLGEALKRPPFSDLRAKYPPPRPRSQPGEDAKE